MPLYPQNATSQKTCSNSFSFHCFIFGFAVESIKKLGSVSIMEEKEMETKEKKK